MYFEALKQAMGMLAEHPQTLFVGQAVAYPGQAAFKTFDAVPKDKRIEMPVCEDFQMGFCTGLALQGFIPISFYPRMDFLIIAANQLVNHLDKLTAFSPKVIIRSAVGSKTPLDPGPQHTQNHCKALRLMLSRIKVYELLHASHIVPLYRKALESPEPTILIEHMELYR